MAFSFPSTLKTRFTHVSQHDPALDTESEAFDYQQWLDTGDAQYIPLKPGQTPTEFTLAKLEPALLIELRGELVSAAQASELSEDASEAERNRAALEYQRSLAPLALAALAYGLKKASGVKVPLVKDDEGRERVSPEFCTQLFYQSEALAGELGIRVLLESMGIQNQKKA